MDIIPWNDELLCPSSLKIFIVWEEVDPSEIETAATTEEQDEAWMEVQGNMSNKVPLYCAARSNDPIDGSSDVGISVVGPKLRFSKDVQHILLAPTVNDLIASRVYVLPRGGENTEATLNTMVIAWEGGYLPVFYGNPLPDKDLTLESGLSIQISTTVDGKKALRSFMAEVSSNPRLALTRLTNDLDSFQKRSKGIVPCKISVFRFKAGNQYVSHPALILD